MPGTGNRDDRMPPFPQDATRLRHERLFLHAMLQEVDHQDAVERAVRELQTVRIAQHQRRRIQARLPEVLAPFPHQLWIQIHAANPIPARAQVQEQRPRVGPNVQQGIPSWNHPRRTQESHQRPFPQAMPDPLRKCPKSLRLNKIVSERNLGMSCDHPRRSGGLVRRRGDRRDRSGVKRGNGLEGRHAFLTSSPPART